MPWPASDLDTTELRSQSGNPSRARPQLKKALDYIGQIIRARGSRDGGGIAPLDAAGKVPVANLPGLQLTQAERAKLAGIEADAAADQTGAQIRDLLDAVLGSAAWRTPVAASFTARQIWAGTQNLPNTGSHNFGSIVPSGATMISFSVREYYLGSLSSQLNGVVWPVADLASWVWSHIGGTPDQFANFGARYAGGHLHVARKTRGDITGLRVERVMAW